jgi:hypothetical protein
VQIAATTCLKIATLWSTISLYSKLDSEHGLGV